MRLIGFKIIVLIFVLVSVILLFFGNILLSPSDPQSGSDEQTEDEIIRCATLTPDSFDAENVGLPGEENETVLTGSSEPEGDCVIYSVAMANYKLNLPGGPSLQELYTQIKQCAIRLGIYPWEVDGGAIRKQVEDLCKAEIAEGYLPDGGEETFIRVYATADNPNPVRCPPFRDGDWVTMTVAGSPPSTDLHSVTCKIRCNLLSTTGDCHDRISAPGQANPITYPITIDTNGAVSGLQGSYSATSASMPVIS